MNDVTLTTHTVLWPNCLAHELAQRGAEGRAAQELQHGTAARSARPLKQELGII